VENFVVQAIIGGNFCGIDFFLSGENLCCKLFYQVKIYAASFFIGGNFVV
jgi:hypothetical protein